MRVSKDMKKVSLTVYEREMSLSDKELRIILEEYFLNEAAEQETTSNGLRVQTVFKEQEDTDMKLSEDKKKLILTVNGRKKKFSDKELKTILKKYFFNKDYEQVIISNGAQEQIVCVKKWLEVNPQAIDQSLFQEKREHRQQERTRQLILEAFVEVKNNPKKYGKKFKITTPFKTWSEMTAKELDELACKIGDHNADWVEQALVWAQKICNEGSWENICNNSNPAKNYNLVLWKNGFYRIVGGSKIFRTNKYPESYVDSYGIYLTDKLAGVVPLIVLYEK